MTGPPPTHGLHLAWTWPWLPLLVFALTSLGWVLLGLLRVLTARASGRAYASSRAFAGLGRLLGLSGCASLGGVVLVSAPSVVMRSDSAAEAFDRLAALAGDSQTYANLVAFLLVTLAAGLLAMLWEQRALRRGRESARTGGAVAGSAGRSGSSP